MNDITKRFMTAVTHVTTNNIVKNKKELASKIGIGQSSLSEIISNRTNVGIKIIQNFVVSFDMIDAHWLLTGKGEMLKKETHQEKTDCKDIESELKFLKEKIKYLENEAKLKDRIIELLQEKTKQTTHKKPARTQK